MTRNELKAAAIAVAVMKSYLQSGKLPSNAEIVCRLDGKVAEDILRYCASVDVESSYIEFSTMKNE